MSTQDLLTPTQDALIEIRVLCCAAMNPEETTTHEDAVAAIAKVVDGMMKPASKKLRLKPLQWKKMLNGGYAATCFNSGFIYLAHIDGLSYHPQFTDGVSPDTNGIDCPYGNTLEDAQRACEDHRNARVFAQLEEVNP